MCVMQAGKHGPLGRRDIERGKESGLVNGSVVVWEKECLKKMKDCREREILRDRRKV